MSERQQHKAAATARVPAACVGAAAVASAAAKLRRQKLLGLLVAAARAGDPAPARADLVERFAISPFTLRDDFAAMRRAGLVESDSRKWGRVPGMGNMTVEMRYRVKVDGAWTWTAWPTSGPTPSRKSGGLPPQLWAVKSSNVSATSDNRGPVEQAKQLLRIARQVPVYHLSTLLEPEKYPARPSRVPGDADVVVGATVMSERDVVALARQLSA